MSNHPGGPRAGFPVDSGGAAAAASRAPPADGSLSRPPRVHRTIELPDSHGNVPQRVHPRFKPRDGNDDRGGSLGDGGPAGERSCKAGVEGGQLTIHTQLITLTKAEIIATGFELGVDYSLTSSCYDPSESGNPCGHCDSCLLRLKGFAEAGHVDPLKYQAA